MPLLCLLLCILFVVMSSDDNHAQPQSDLNKEKRSCSHATLPVFPSQATIASGLDKLDSIAWVNAKQYMLNNVQQIPRIIWVNGKGVMNQLSVDHRRMMSNNTNYLYAYIDDEEAELFLNEVFRDTSYLWAYYNLNHQLGAGKADFFRYAALYVFGGIYIDMDSVVYHKFDDYLRPEDSFIVGAEQPFYYSVSSCYHKDFYLHSQKFNRPEFISKLEWSKRKVTQSMLISKARHPYIIKTMENIVEIFNQLKCKQNNKVFTEHINPQRKLLCSTGPDVVTASVRQSMFESSGLSNLGVRYAGLSFIDLGKLERVLSSHANSDRSDTHWKKLLDSGVNLMADYTV